MSLFGRLTRSGELLGAGQPRELEKSVHYGDEHPEVIRAREEVERARQELDIAHREWEDAAAQVEEARTSMLETKSEWLAASRIDIESYAEVCERLFSRAVKKLYKDIEKSSTLYEACLADLPKALDEGRLFATIAEAQVEMMEVRNRLVQRVGEVQFLWNAIDLDGHPEVIEDGMEMVGDLDRGIDQLSEIAANY